MQKLLWCAVYVVAGILQPVGLHAQLTIPQSTATVGMRNADAMNQALKNAEARAKAASARGATTNSGGIWGAPPAVPTPSAAMLPFGHFAIRYPSNCGLVPPDQKSRLPVVTGNQPVWAGIQCSDGVWLQAWVNVIEQTNNPLSVAALADVELSYFNGPFEARPGLLGPLSTSRLYNSDPKGACQVIVGLENDWSDYTFVLCYPNRKPAWRTRDQLSSGLTRLGPQSPRFRLPIGKDCTVNYHENLDTAYWCTDGTYVDVSSRALFGPVSLTLEEFANQKSTMSFGDDDSLAEREPYQTSLNTLGPMSTERLHKVSDQAERTCADIVTQEDAGWFYVIRYCYNHTPEGLRNIAKFRAGIQRGGVLPGVELYPID